MKYITGLALVALASMPAHAQISEVRAGLAQHDLGWATTNAAGDEEALIAINAEIIFDEPEFLRWAFSPQPYVGGTLNLEGRTSYGGAGLMWRQTLSDRVYGDFALGLVVHDGLLSAGDAFDDREVGENVIDVLQRSNFYGSRVLFRPALTIGVRLDEDWAAEVFLEHISHGGLLSDRANEGSDAGGFRVARRF